MNLGPKDNSNNKKSEESQIKKNNEKHNNLFSDSEKSKVEQNEESNTSNKSPKSGIFIIGGIIVGIVIILVLLITLIFSGNDEPVNSAQQNEQVVQQENLTDQQVPTPQQAQSNNSNNEQNSNQSNGTSEGNRKDVGFQDFTGDTNMQTSTTLDDPDSALKDIYGLSVRVDYNVDDIDYVTDFVNYKKHRGTWGGGLELYWLEATYKDIPYIIQIPFKYYKELDDTGIVPVKMEVLRVSVTGSSDGSERTIVSFMELDEATLKTLLKNKK